MSRLGRPTKRTPHLEALILAELSFGYQRKHAICEARIDRSTLYRWMARDPEFALAVAVAEGRPAAPEAAPDHD